MNWASNIDTDIINVAAVEGKKMSFYCVSLQYVDTLRDNMGHREFMVTLQVHQENWYCHPEESEQLA